MLLQGTGLQQHRIKPGGAMDGEQGKWLPSVLLERAMNYVAQLRLVK